MFLVKLEPMGRLPRAIDDGLVYHALNRGNNSTVVFKDDDDHVAFLEALALAKQRVSLRASWLLPDAQPFPPACAAGGRSVDQPDSPVANRGPHRALHRRHHSTGHVWQGRFKSPVIQEDAHLLVVLRYIEANPLRAKMVADLADYRWSSYPSHGLGQDDPLLSPFPAWDKLGRSNPERRRRWLSKVHAVQAEAELTAIRDSLRSGRPYGSPEWLEQIAQQLDIDLTPRRRGRPPKS